MKYYCVQVALDLLVAAQKASDLPPETKLNQREFYSELAIGVIDKVFALEKAWEQLQNVIINLIKCTSI